MKRLLKFVRSVLPRDPTQLVFLLGVLCLFLSPHLRWGPPAAFGTPIGIPLDPRALVIFALYAIHFAGSAGFLFCFRPSNYPSRLLLWLVCCPALVGVSILILSCCAFLLIGPASGSETGRFSLRYLWSPSVLPNLGPGIHYSLVGLVLVASFVVGISLGSTSLPLALPESSVSPVDDSASWNRVELFLWVLLALLPLILWIWFPPVMNFIFDYFLFSRSPALKSNEIATFIIQNFVLDCLVIAIAIWIIGKVAWDAVRRSLRLPAPEGFALAIAFPVAISALISFGQFLLALLRLAFHQFHMLRIPDVGPYVVLPNIGLLWLLLKAFSEELLFRALLQPLFVRRYGILRGIFLVGVVFAAVHLSSDFSAGYTDGLVIVKLCLRLLQSLGLSFVVGWLILQTRSVFPSAVAHGLGNVLGNSPFGPAFWGIGPLIDFLWVILAYLLFLYWPVRELNNESERVLSPS